jgi:hypothetical protein
MAERPKGIQQEETDVRLGLHGGFVGALQERKLYRVFLSRTCLSANLLVHLAFRLSPCSSRSVMPTNPFPSICFTPPESLAM